MFAGILAINLLVAEGETSPGFGYKNGESSIFFLYYNTKYLSVIYVEIQAYSTAMCDIPLEREFNYLLYGISQVHFG